ncbi:MAG: TIGR04255 family protein [Acidobacteria bacterium]|nr:TIGR04255 family protein [Acidobacteriota bacterium]
MAQPSTLRHPPIVEALVDLRASVPGAPKMFMALADELKDEFPTTEERQELRSTIEVKEGKLVPPRVDPPAFGGVQIANVDQTIYVQFRPDGFTLNNLKSYMGGGQLIEKALGHWELLVERAKPEIVSRVALRYINRLELPFERGDKFTRYLTAAPELPEGAPQQVSRFLTRVVGHDERRQATAVVSQQLRQQKGKPVVTVDIDVYRTEDFPVDSVALREVLDSLRVLKNETFFSLLTDETVNFYK